ncbi:MAG TPA: class I SAM-dependent methyltransferase [Afifellaceae bacterium]|nr:class I SAM-dependent methyltransferase [Afifellaceae bacterium]
MRSKNEDHWEGVYGSRDDKSLSWFQQHAEPGLGLIRRHARSKSARIVDVGAGTSRLVDELLDDGFSKITLVEISRSALERTARRLGGQSERVTFIQADVTDWKPESVWDIWHDRAVFHFLTDTSDQEAYLQALRAGTASGSIVIIGTFAPDAPERCSGLPVQRYSAGQLQARLGAEFELLESTRHIHLTPAEKEQPFTFAVFRRR